MEGEITTAKALEEKQLAAINSNKRMSDQLKKKIALQVKAGGREGRQASRFMDHFGVEDFTKDEGWKSGKQVEDLKKNKQASIDAAKADKTSGDKRQRLLIAASKLETKILENRRAALDLELEAAESKTLGLTTVGQLVNLEGDRLKTAKSVLTAEENLATAKFAFNNSEAEAGSEKKKQAKENMEIAEKQLKLAEANAKFAKMQADEKERELKFRRDLLIAAKEEQALNNKIAALKNQGKFLKGTSDGSAASAGEIYANKGEILQVESEKARQKAITAAAVYNETYQAKLRELERIEMEKTGGPISDATQTRLQDEAMLQTDSSAMDSANNANASALTELEIHKQIKQTALDKVATDTKNLETRAQANYFDQAGLQFLEKKMELESQFGPMSDKELANLEAQTRKQHDLNQLIEMKQGIADSITGNMESAFMSIVDGSKSAKEAFADMAKAILADVAKMIIKLLIQKAIMAAMGMADGGIAEGGAVAAANGGIFGPRSGRKYTSGGIARGETQGYPATLHGTEAVVPLPHNRKIPVELMGGAGGQQNNVSVTVNMANGGQQNQQTGQGDSNQANQLGDIIAKAVQAELQNQKRSGGILNPYGVA